MALKELIIDLEGKIAARQWEVSIE